MDIQVIHGIRLLHDYIMIIGVVNILLLVLYLQYKNMALCVRVSILCCACVYILMCVYIVRLVYVRIYMVSCVYFVACLCCACACILFCVYQTTNNNNEQKQPKSDHERDYINLVFEVWGS